MGKTAVGRGGFWRRTDGRGREDASTIRKDNAPENLSLLKKIVLNILRTDTSGRQKTSRRLRRKRAAWDDDLRAQLLGLNHL